MACCLSFEATKQSGLNAARRRGRIYIGPLNTTTGIGDANNTQRPSPTFAATLRNAAKAFRSAVNNSGYVWVVHSPTGGPTSRAAVASIWTDDAFDTQRRRGAAPKAKVRETIAQIALAA